MARMARRPEIRLHAEPPAATAAGAVVLAAEFPFAGRNVALHVEVPDRRLSLADVVPLAREVCDRLTEAVIGAVQAAGRDISCRKGCGVCCTNHLVPLTVPEAFRLQQEFDALPAGRRGELDRAFTGAAEEVDESGLAEDYGRLDKADPLSERRQRDLAGKWWSQRHFPCPLLARDACSLYPFRPIPCREFLVVSPPERCATNTETRVRRPFSVHDVLADWAAEMEGTAPTLVLLPNFLPWTQGKVSRSQRTWRGPGMVRRWLDRLTATAAQADAGYAGPVPT